MLLSFLFVITITNPTISQPQDASEKTFPPFKYPLVWKVTHIGANKSKFIVTNTETGETWTGKKKGVTTSSASSSNLTFKKSGYKTRKGKSMQKLTHPLSGEKLKIHTQIEVRYTSQSGPAFTTRARVTIRDDKDQETATLDHPEDSKVLLLGKLGQNELTVDRLRVDKEKLKKIDEKYMIYSEKPLHQQELFTISVNGKIAAWFERIRTFKLNQPYILYLNSDLDGETQNELLTVLMAFHITEDTIDSASQNL